MQNIINRSFMVIWLPFAVMTVLLFLLSANGINFTQTIFDFIVGNPFDKISIIVGMLWLFSTSWALVAFLNRNVFESNLSDHSQTHGNLYKITSIRETALKHVSACAHNNESKRVIRKYNPSSKQLTEEEVAVIDVSTSEPNSVVTGKSDNGGKKEVTAPADLKYAEIKSTMQRETGNAVAYAIINTAIKGESFATDDVKEKYKDMLKRIADKQKSKLPKS